MQELKAGSGHGIDREKERDATYTLGQRQIESDPLENDVFCYSF